jgi:DNA-binding PadR family transcriptional regulator
MNKGKKFNAERKRKFSFFSIIKRIHDGDTPFDIYTSWGWGRKKLDYWIHKIEKLGFIEQKYRTSHVIYQVTEQGENFYRQCMEQLPMGNINLHNIAWTANLELPSDSELQPDKTWINNSGLNSMKKFGNITAVWNKSSITLYVTRLLGSDPFKLQDMASVEKDRIANKLRESGFKIGEFRQSRKGHYGVIDVVATKLAKSMELKTDIAKIDQSEGYGELEFFEPEDVNNYLKAMINMGKMLPVIVQQQAEFSKNLMLHLEVLTEMKNTLKKMEEKMK